MIGIIVAILVAALVFWFCTFIGLPYIVAVIAAILVLLAAMSQWSGPWPPSRFRR